jgi:hypothetical protein
VEEDVLVLCVGDLFPGLEPPHGLSHVLGLQWGRVPPLLTNIQGWEEGDEERESLQSLYTRMHHGIFFC